MRILTAAEIKGLEELAVESGTSMETLMENAGAVCAEFIQSKTDVREKRTVILAGKGNNGGDGFVIARILSKAGAKVTVVLVQGAPAGELAKQAYDTMHKGIEIITARSAAKTVDTAEIIVDAIFGFNFHGRLPAAVAALLQRANLAKAMRVAVDLPSGAECDTGFAEPDSFRADYTVTFTSRKPAHVVYPAAGFCGDVAVRSVGIRQDFLQMLPHDMASITLSDLRPLFPKRAAESHKGTYGRLLMVCGSVGMAGACIMAARAALRSGVGLLELAVPHALYPVIAPALPEAVFTLYDVGDGLEAQLAAALSRSNACLVGCGLGTTQYAKRLVETVLQNAKCPLVLDADALNLIAASPVRLLETQAPVIVTPHPGEMARLTAKTVDATRADRVHTAKEFTQKYNVITVLKGAGTVIASPGGDVRINTTGNAGMAKGGSGDVLAGIAASLAAQGMEPFTAAYAAACIHGAAGDICAEALSEQAMLPTDMIEALPKVFLRLRKRPQ